MIGIVFLYFVKGGFIDLIGYIIFSVYMFEMVVMYIVVLLLLLFGILIWLYCYIIFFKFV